MREIVQGVSWGRPVVVLDQARRDKKDTRKQTGPETNDFA